MSEFLLTAEEIKTLNAIQTKLYESAKAAGWHNKPREFGTGMALIHSEVSEALEGYRKDKMDDHLPDQKNAPVELADAFIRICDEMGKHNWQLGTLTALKHAYNQIRPDHKLEARALPGGKSF